MVNLSTVNLSTLDDSAKNLSIITSASNVPRVGINQNIPLFTLDVGGTANVSGTVTGPSLTADSSSLTSLSNINVIGNTATFSNIQIGALSTSSSSITQRDSNIGIGKTDPSYMLDVAGSVNVAGSMTAKNDLIFAAADYGTEKFSIDSATVGTVTAGQLTPFASSKEGSIAISKTNYLTFTNSIFTTPWWLSGGFTMECWVNYPSLVIASQFYPLFPLGMMDSSGSVCAALGATNLKKLIYYYAYPGGNTSTALAGTTTLEVNTWYHIAVTYDTSRSMLSLFLNGALENEGPLQGTPNAITVPKFSIGGVNPGSASVTNARLVYGASLNTSPTTFPVSAGPLVPSTSGTTALLLRVPQSSASYAIVDSSLNAFSMGGYTVGTVGTSKESPFSSSYDDGSINFNGTAGNYMSLPNQLGFKWYESSTVEAWVNYKSFTGTSHNFAAGVHASSLMGLMLPTIGHNDWSFGAIETGQVALYYYPGSMIGVTTDTSITLNTWNHIAMTCDGTTINIFINGTLAKSAAMVGVPNISTASFTIGQFVNKNTNALISNMRIVSGAVLYTSNFTTSTAPLGPASSGKTLLLIKGEPNKGRVLTSKIGGTRVVRAYPPAALTSNMTSIQNAAYGTGTYVTTSSGNADNNIPYLPFNVFDKVVSTYWQAPTGLYDATAAFVGAIATADIFGNSYKGVWLQIQLPIPIVLASYSLTSFYLYPSNFHVLGSKDGQSWQCINQQVGNTKISVSPTVDTTLAFSYYRLVINKQTGSDGSFNSACCNEWVLYGTQESINISADSQVGVGVVKPKETLEVAGNSLLTGYISAGNIGAFKNRIINGDMRIAQRGTTVLSSSGSPGTGRCVDRFVLNTSITTGLVTVDQKALISSDTPFTYGFKNSLRFTVTAACTSYGWIAPEQCIEGLNTSDFMWGTSFGVPMTVSFWLKTNLPAGSLLPCAIRGTATVATRYLTSVTIVGPSVWQYVSYVVPPPPVETIWGVTSNDGVDVFIGARTGDAGQSVGGWHLSPSGELHLASSTNVWDTINNYIEFTGLQVEKGPLATPFEFRPYATELQLCQRYYEKSFAQGTAPANNVREHYVTVGTSVGGSVVASKAMTGFIPFKVTKRAPGGALTVYNPYAANTTNGIRGWNSFVDYVVTTNDVDAGATSTVTDTGFKLVVNAAVDTTLCLHYAIDADL